MDVYFSSKSLMNRCTDPKKRARKFGHQRGEELKIVLDELEAAKNLKEVSELPHRRLHRLSGDRDGDFSVDIDSQYRLLFSVSEEEATDEDGNLDFETVTEIVINWAGDPHD